MYAVEILTVLRSGQWKLYKNRVTREWNVYNTACDWIIELNEIIIGLYKHSTTL